MIHYCSIWEWTFNWFFDISKLISIFLQMLKLKFSFIFVDICWLNVNITIVIEAHPLSIKCIPPNSHWVLRSSPYLFSYNFLNELVLFRVILLLLLFFLLSLEGPLMSLFHFFIYSFITFFDIELTGTNNNCNSNNQRY